MPQSQMVMHRRWSYGSLARPAGSLTAGLTTGLAFPRGRGGLRVVSKTTDQAAQSTCDDHYGQTKAEDGCEESDQTKTGLDGETDE